MKLKTGEIGRCVDLGPYPTNKQIREAKRLMRDKIKLDGLDLIDLKWVVDIPTGKIGWRAVDVAVKPPFGG